MAARLLPLLVVFSVAACIGQIQGPALNVFGNPEIRAFLECAARHQDAPITSCSLSHDKINERGSGDITPLLWLLENSSVSPSGVREMVKSGANPFVRHEVTGQTAVSHIISTMSLDYLRAVVEGGVDPNADQGRGLVYSVRESAFTHWDDAKVSYLIDKGLDLERRNANGYTAILEAGYIVHEGGPFKKQLFLLDRGADPKARNNAGQGICYGIENDIDLGKPGEPDYRLILAKRLEDKFDIRCRSTERFRPPWRCG